MQSLVSYPICRINFGPDLVIAYGTLVIASLAIFSISISGFGIALKLVLILLAASYVVQCFLNYRKQAIYTLQSNAYGALFLVNDHEQHKLQNIVWRDWGFLIECQTILQGRPISRCWFCARISHEQCRQLRLMISAQNKKVVNTMPSIITNPVL